MKPGKNKPNGIEILIAEDSRTQAEKLQHLLEEHGYTAVTAPDGKQALAAARRSKPTLVISDVLMPELDGYGLCKAIKSDDKLKDVLVVLVTSLSDSQDVIRGLECGADNFVRKPYDEHYLLSRIEHLLMNRELRKSQKMQLGVEIELGGRKHFITSERQQILDLLISTYEQAVGLNAELRLREKELAHSNQVLQGLYRIAEGLNRAVSEHEVGEAALDRAMELPGVRAGWIRMLEGDAKFRTIASRGLPPAMSVPDAFEDDCMCQRKLLSGELDHVTNILECERLGRAKGDTQGLRFHASVPLWLEGRILGVMNLAGPEGGLFAENELEVLYSVGHQVAIALERARLHEHLEELVEERTAKLVAEVEQRKRIQGEQARLVAIVESTTDLVGTATKDGRLLYCNQAGLRMLGYEPGLDVSALSLYDAHPEWAAKLVREEGIPHAISHGTWSGETAFLRTDGREIPISQVIIAHKGADGSMEYLSTVARDITSRKEAEKRVMRLNRVYSVLSGINTTIVRVRERQELFAEACRIAVEHGQFRFAWIGMLEAETQKVIPVATAGHDDGYLAQINLTTVKDAPGSCELTAIALTQAKPVVCNDIASDDRMKVWRAEALKRGYRSVALFPLILDSRSLGVFLLYAPEPDFFDEEEMKLLVEMAGDISFALKHIGNEERLNYLAYFDEITGLPNRALFSDRFDQRLSAARHDRQGCSLVILDVERFRSVNETLGRQAGDELLRLLAQRLQEGLDETDVLARLSGDCFGIATRRTVAGSDISAILDQILFRIQARPFAVGGKELRLAAKAGVAVFPGDGEDVETLYRNAEAALRDAKASGQRYLFYAPQMNARVAEKLSIENKLRKAVEREEFVLHYQPKISLVTKRITGVEALIRWADPEVGLVAPGLFIPVLEETGLILEVGKWVMKQALVDLDRWCAAGAEPVRIAVNVSAIQLRQKSFVDDVQKVVAARKDLAASLEMEITESLIMEDIEQNVPKLAAIRELGATVAVDDFGTGYSSLSYIARLPISALKIDQSFVESMADSPDSMSIVQTIISLAHSLKLNVVAEGVETAEQEKLLGLLRCDEAQGFLFGRPLA
ncbi:MAG: EAL domain-containing protein, partial [Burkholderiales bacterium]